MGYNISPLEACVFLYIIYLKRSGLVGAIQKPDRSYKVVQYSSDPEFKCLVPAEIDPPKIRPVWYSDPHCRGKQINK
jgi:hypothetical protein